MRGRWCEAALQPLSSGRIFEAVSRRIGFLPGTAMDFPITDLMDEDACYAKLVEWLHPEGLACPRCHQADRMRAHRSHRAHVRDYRCGHCRRVFNAFTGTIVHGTRRRPSELVLIV